jgi:hypothetical protein
MSKIIDGVSVGIHQSTGVDNAHKTNEEEKRISFFFGKESLIRLL